MSSQALRARAAALVMVTLCAACQGSPSSVADAGPLPPRTGPCAENNPLRNVYFGDLHVHTSLSFDAYTYRVRALPADAYRFAQGQPLEATGGRKLTLRRPLDFAAVTEHADFLGEVSLCSTPGSAVYDSDTCKSYRNLPYGAVITWGLRLQHNKPDRYAFCGADGKLCLSRADEVWKRIQQAADDATDKSEACRFTAFKAYEWSGFPLGENLHRNVIFAGDKVPSRVVGYFDEPTPQGLWRRLRADCLDGLPGCDVLAIPHNSNLSRGKMFAPIAENGSPLTAAQATARVAIEPLVEVMQHKGDSECGTGAPDELCGFEKYELSAAFPLSFVREALKKGLAEHARIGVNPFKLGLTAATDAHNANPGAVAERSFPGAFGVKDDTPGKLLSQANLPFNPGGLMAVWADENSRSSLFAAMKRREVYGTSGPRIVLRFFGGWSYKDQACDTDGDKLAKAGYDGGVPMGGTLPARPAGSPPPPTLLVAAQKDPGTPQMPGAQLERVQVIKGWLAADGTLREKVYDIAGKKTTEGVDLASCRTRASGFDSICRAWSDPDFDPKEAAFYYVRAVEVPTCRWNSWICVDQKVDCNKGAPPALAVCCSSDKSVPRTIRERAWSSPIWYVP